MLTWLSFFSLDRTFTIYVGHLETACRVRGIDTAWRTKEVATAIRGRAEAGSEENRSQRLAYGKKRSKRQSYGQATWR